MICATFRLFLHPPKNKIMAYEKKNGDISVFTNESNNANAPRWKGSLLLDGKEYSVSLWVKSGAKGEFLAGSVQPKQSYADRQADTTPYVYNPPKSDTNGDLPF